MTKLDVSSGFYTNNQGPDGFRIRILDSTSGTQILKLDLSADQVLGFLRGTHQSVDGELGTQLGRIGKTMEHQVVEVPRAITSSTYDRDQQEIDALEFAKNVAPGWETYTPSRTNNGTVNVVVRRWV